MGGARLSREEKSFFTGAQPWGFILFARNCGSPQQIKSLIAELHDVTGRDRLPILIDQEGGRVARLKPPHWPEYPPAGVFAALGEKNIETAARAVWLNARLIAHDLAALGITVDCAPVADLPVSGAHDIIGDRAFGHEPQQVIRLARAQAGGLLAGGVAPVLKHIPGHGRASADSHEELPVVDAPLAELRVTDFVPFAALADLPMAMTAHVLYPAVDAKRMATLSPAVISLIREEIGFKGLLMSDDLSMKAMQGGYAERARAALDAGCDVALHCNGDMKEMAGVADGARTLAGESLSRAESAMKSVGAPNDFDVAEARAELKTMMA